MKIKEIHIYGYGKFIDYTIKDIDSFQLVFGENEAGKSTIMSFIRSVLFGFPTQRQTANRYEPKHHSAYGGFIICHFEQYGEVKIERVRGKAVGDVTVYLKNGTIGNERLLHELLDTIDETLFDQVYTFNLQGIQEIEKLKDDDINRYLISAGTTGSNQLLKLEEELAKEMDGLFLRRGQKPPINQALNELREADQKLKKAKLNQSEYQVYVNEKSGLEQSIANMNEMKAKYEDQLNDSNHVLNHWDLAVERDQLRIRKQQIGEFSFPIDGLKRLESLLAQITIENARYETVYNRLEKYTQELLEINDVLKDENTQIELGEIVNEAPRYQLLKDEMNTYKQKIEQLQLKINNICDELNLSDDAYNQIETINLSIQMKNKIKELVQEQRLLQSKEKEIEIELEHIQNRQSEVEEKERYIHEQLISEAEFKQLSHAVKQHMSSEQLFQEKLQVEAELNNLDVDKRQKQQNEKRQTQSAQLINILFAVTSIGLFIWSLLAKQWVPFIFAIFITIIFIVHLQRAKAMRNTKTDYYRDHLKKRLSELTIQLGKINHEDVTLYEQQTKLRETWKEIFKQLEQNEQLIQQYTEKLIAIKTSLEVIMKECQQIKKSLYLHDDFQINELEHAFEILQSVRSEVRNEQLLREQLLQLTKEWDDWHTRLKSIASELSYFEQDAHTLVYKLKEYLQSAQKKNIQKQDLKWKIEEETNELQNVSFKRKQIENQMVELYQLAQVEDEEAFRLKAKEKEDYTNINRRLELLEPKLQSIVTIEHMTEEKLKETKGKCIEQIQYVSQQLEMKRQRLAHVQHAIEQFESGGIYTDLLHDYYQLHTHFNDEARRWFELAVARQLLTNTLEEYKLERLPKVMEMAIKYFSVLTNGEYTHITFKNDIDLIVESKNRTLFTPNELSQGTKEQLYIAFRLALITILKETITFPIIIDDGLVNFDKNRTKEVLHLLHEVGIDTQVLFFSCHEYTKNEFNHIYHLNK